MMNEIVKKTPIPRKLNQGMIEALSLAIAKGNYAVTACQLCDIDESTLWHWVDQGTKDYEAGLENLYTELIIALKRAEAQAEAELVNVVRESATIKKEWLPAMTFLERRHPDRWGRKDRTRVDINERKSVVITHVEVVLNETKAIEGEYKELEEGSQDATELTGSNSVVTLSNSQG